MNLDNALVNIHFPFICFSINGRENFGRSKTKMSYNKL